LVLAALPASVESALWRGDQLGSVVTSVLPSGFEALDAQLPGGGWPCQAITEVLAPQFSVLEWRLLAPALKQVCARRESIAVVAPPKAPHLPGLRHEGVDDRHLIWVQADAPAQRLWAIEQLIKANACGAIVGWLPQVRQEQVRRLQVLAAQCDAPVFLCRPSSAAAEASAAPLRIQARTGPDWELFIEIIKRKGPPLEQTLRLPSIPGGLRSIVTPRLLYPSRLMNQEHHDAVVRLAPEYIPSRQSISH
jgi:protein ImuA